MKKVLGTSWGLALLVSLVTLGGTGATAPTASAVSLDCTQGNLSPCIKYCWVGTKQYPCGVGRVPNLTSGTYSFTVPLSAADQNATGIPGDPGGTGTSSINMNVATNQVCATTSWSGVDSPVGAAHIHGGGYGQPENPAITISLFPPDLINGKPSPQSGCALAPPGLMWVMNQCPAQFNVVVHSKKHPVGAIRGQLGTTCTP
jgi:hypothetical protein